MPDATDAPRVGGIDSRARLPTLRRPGTEAFLHAYSLSCCSLPLVESDAEAFKVVGRRRGKAVNRSDLNVQTAWRVRRGGVAEHPLHIGAALSARSVSLQ